MAIVRARPTRLVEINDKDKLIRPGMRILDLGSAPGGCRRWPARLSATWAGSSPPNPRMDALKNVDFIQGDFTDDAIVSSCWTGWAAASSISSSPTLRRTSTGITVADQASSIYFLELALDTVQKTLKPGATFVAKMFQGTGSDQYLKELRKHFDKVLIRKPAASRKESREVYLVAKGFKGL